MEKLSMHTKGLIDELLRKDMDIRTGLARMNVEGNTELRFLKPKQLQALQNSRRCDCFVALKTGYGKTLIFQMLPYVFKSAVIVICPLDVIISQCLERFTGIVHVDGDFLNAVSVMEFDDTQQLQNGVKYYIGHPEQVTSPVFKEFLLKTSVKICHIVVDEAHCVPAWGLGSDKGEAFRRAFSEIRTLRSVLPEAKLLALTATATDSLRREIQSCLLMGTVFPLHVINACPDREAVFISVQPRPPSTGGHDIMDSYSSVLDPLFNELSEKGETFPKTVVYLPLVWCGTAHYLAQQRLPSELHHRVAQFHSPQSKVMKGKIPAQLASSEVLLVFATEAFGMGADVKDIRRIIHITCPASTETYLQEIGRAGRDGRGAHATLYFNSTDLASKTVSLAMKEFCTTGDCRRSFLLQQFGHTVNATDPHQCCDNCLIFCECMECGSFAESPTVQQQEPNVNAAVLEEAKTFLRCYIDQVNASITDCMFPEAVTGLTPHIIDKLAKFVLNSCDNLSDSLATSFPCISADYLTDIAAIIGHLQSISTV